MTTATRNRPARLTRGLGLFGMALILATAPVALGQDPAPNREAQIAEIQRQIEELSKKLGELKAAPESSPAEPESGLKLAPEFVQTLNWRPLGPATMGGRIVALSVFVDDPSTFWVATASGGLLKTTNNGITFEHQFDKEATVSIGDVCVAPSDKNIVWVGTGENNPRNSVSYGDGVYKSTDGGKTWENMGLKGTFQVGRIAVHPKNPDVVYVGALGRLYGPNEERGLFKTADGGKTWEKILYVDDRTGVIDLRLKPDDPETLIVATYERERDLYDVNDPSKKYGPGAGLHKSTDGGKTWKKLTEGLPTVQLGRIGLDWYRKDPNVVFAIIETEKIGSGPPGARPPGQGRGRGGRGGSGQQEPAPSPVYLGIVGEGPEAAGPKLGQVVPGGPADKAGLKVGDLVLAVGDTQIKTYPELIDAIRGRKPGDTAKFKLKRGDDELEVEVTFEARPEPPAEEESESGDNPLGLNPTRPFGGLLGGQIENVQDRQGPEGFQYGGIYKSTDAGETWTRVNSLNPRPMYFSQVRVDPSDDTYLYVAGIAFYRSGDGGKTFRGDAGRSVHADHHALWVDPRDGRHMILGTDGGVYVTYDRTLNWDHLNHAAIAQFYHVALDPRMPFKAYGGLQDNGSWGGPGMVRSGRGAINEDWIEVGGGDGFKCFVDPDDPDLVYSTSQNGNLRRTHLKTGESRSIRPRLDRGTRNRFNWNTPFLLSHHNSKIYYAAGSFVFRSLNRGDDLRPISPKLTKTDAGSATALAESPRNPDIVYVGTDDGQLWVTRDGGRNWEEVSGNVGLPKPCYVATIEASRSEDGRAYACFDGHRSDIDDPLIFVTDDYGKTWKNLGKSLPRGSTRCLREDIENADVLWLGTEFAAWASVDRGASWTKINSNLPTVAIHEIAQHPISGEIVAATHGRSLWALEVGPIRQSSAEILKAPGYLYRPAPAYRWKSEPRRGGTNRRFVAQNPPSGAQLYYVLSKKAEKVELKVLDYDGTTVRDLRVSPEPGLHRVAWDLTRPAPPRTDPTPAVSTTLSSVLSSVRRNLAASAARPQPVPPGTYRVVLVADGKEIAQPVRVLADPDFPPPGILASGELEEAEADLALGFEAEQGDDEEAVERALEARGDDGR